MEKTQELFWLRTWVAWRIGSLQKWIPTTLAATSIPFHDFLKSERVKSKVMATFFKNFPPMETEFLIYESRGEFYLTNIRLILLKIEKSSSIYKSINVQDILNLEARGGGDKFTLIVNTSKDEAYVFNRLHKFDLGFDHWNPIVQYAQSENAWQDVKEKFISSSNDEPVENSIILNTAPLVQNNVENVKNRKRWVEPLGELTLVLMCIPILYYSRKHGYLGDQGMRFTAILMVLILGRAFQSLFQGRK